MRVFGLQLLLLTLCGCAVSFAEPHTYTDGTELGITMMGSITNPDPTKSVALVKESSGKVSAVRRGHRLGSYVVAEVTYRYMIVTKAAQNYLVYQNKFAGEFVKANDQAPAANQPSFALKDTYSEDGFERRAGKVQMNAAYRNKLINQDLSKILMQATAIPAIEHGEIVGFKLLQIDSDSIYAKAGFLDHDVITSINGQPLNSAAGAVRLLQSLRGESHIDVEFTRGGTTQKLSLKVD